MATNPENEFVEQLRQSALIHEAEEQTDGQLLEGFVRRRDSRALEALMRRHARMVWGVCRRSLANYHDTADAFQTTFVVLILKAASIRSPELVAHWLYRVAHKTAYKAKQMARARSRHEEAARGSPELQPAKSPAGEFGPELWELLDEELSRLPEKYRIVFELCELEGRSRSEVARQLGTPEGTVGSRLARARRMLAKRLTQRGVSVSAVSLAALLPQQVVSGSVPGALLANSIKGLALLAAGETTTAGAISAKVATLAEAVLKSMAPAKRNAAGFLLLMATLGLCGGMAAFHALAGRPAESEPQTGKLSHQNVEAGIAKYGSEAEVRRFAEQILRVRLEATQNPDELVRWSLQFWGEPATRRYAERIPQSEIRAFQYGDRGELARFFSVEAKLDREKGQWTVRGVSEFGGPAPKAAWEVDWKLVAAYTPSTGRWQLISGGWLAAGGEFSTLNELLMHPRRNGLRPVGKKDAKGGER